MDDQEQKGLAISLPASLLGRLMSAVVMIADDHTGLAERRLALLTTLGDLINADCGVWAWGRGRHDTTVAPVAVIDFGVTDEQRPVLMQWGFDQETDRTFRNKVVGQMGASRQVTTLWRDIYSPEEWDAMPIMRSVMLRGRWSSWLHSVRYSDNDTWSNFFLLRNAGQPEFGPQESALVDLALAGVPWLQSTAEETLPPETFIGLTTRQRTVMLMLLQGQARKTIAHQLGITEDTVGDHIKSIYAHFRVGSVSELAAQFLRGR